MAADATGIREYKGAAKATTIVAGITNTSTSFSIADSTGWPTGSVGDFIATLEQGLSTEERILCSALAGGVLTVVTRGYDGTTAVAHAATSSINHTISAIDIAEANYIANFDLTPAKTTPVDADVLPLKTSGVLHFVTWANIKATLLTWLTPLFEAIAGYTTTATAAGTTVLTVSSTRRQFFTGTTTQIVTLPVTSTLPYVGYEYEIPNKSTGIVTVNSSGGNLVYAIPPGNTAKFRCILLTGTTAASWSFDWSGASAAPALGGETLLSTTTLTGGSTTCPTIAGTYKHLRVVFKGVYCNVNGSGLNLRLNGDSGGNYAYENFYNTAATTLAAEGALLATAILAVIPTSPTSAAALRSGMAEVDIFNYTDVGQIDVEYRGQAAENSGVYLVKSQGSARYLNAAAITTVTAVNKTVDSFSGGQMLVYGVN